MRDLKCRHFGASADISWQLNEDRLERIAVGAQLR